jgi:hypothetical protein
MRQNSTKFGQNWKVEFVRDMRPVIMQNVFANCLDKMDADCGTKIIYSFWNLLKLTLLILHWSHQMHFFNGPFYNWRYLSLPTMGHLSLSHSLSLCLSAILPSSTPFWFNIKRYLTFKIASLNKQIPLRTVLISKVTSTRKV